jgi:uncharacterized peroxidase-related enzyme
MSRIAPVDLATVSEKPKALLAAVQKSLGVTPNMFRVVAQSPAALEGLVSLNGALAHGTLGAKVREQIALAVGETNACNYCVSAHSVLGKGAGLGESEIVAAREGHGADAKADAAVHLAQTLVTAKGRATDADLAAAREGGLTDGQIMEVVAVTALNIFTNYVNHVAETDIDFPVVRARGTT